MSREYVKPISEPWFSLIKTGLKKVEGRLNKGDFAALKKGDYIIFTNDSLGFVRRVRVVVTSLHYYNSFAEYLENEGLDRSLPGIENLENGVKVYYKYFTREEETKVGIVAIRLRVLRGEFS